MLQNKENKIIKICMYACAILWAIFSVAPLIFTLMSSFKDTNDIYSNSFALPETISFFNYETALGKADIVSAIFNSFFLAISTTILVVILTTLVAYVITRTGFKLRNLLLTYFVIGLTIPMHTTLIPIADIINRYGFKNQLIPLIFLYATFQLPFAIFMMSGYMRGISKEIDEAAIIDGCGRLRLVFGILLPLAKPAAATISIFTFMSVYNEFIFGLMFLTDKTKYTISVALMSLNGRYSSDKGAIFAAISMFIIPIIIIYVLCQKHVEKGITSGAVKG
ncbi:carbohydrate ABC transporter permease [Clostridium disporicum]|uniref:Sugar ABC transporter permease n=1 Tax=Clostridium disporicum TaxID=84024 RepID=A0A174ATK8_9CLOT|nr:carbohydrate ABC transporter permease [Clostridium disporicum]CUN91874.1 sugar ABC transporter permease [Clostridium disporicum]